MYYASQLSLRRLKPWGKQPKRSGFAARQLVLLAALVMIQHLVLLTLSGVAQAALSYAPNGQVSAVAIGSDGTRYLGGSFTAMALVTGGGAALDSSTAAVNMNFPPGCGHDLRHGTRWQRWLVYRWQLHCGGRGYPQ